MKFTPTLDKEEFEKLSRAEQRVAIAQDVITRDKAGLFGTADDLNFRSTFLYEKSLGEFIASNAKDFFNSKKCHVCAKGALVCAWVGNFNSYTAHDISNFSLCIENPKKYPEQLFEIFGRELLDLIEKAFEGWYEFRGEEYTKKLSLIMQNIVDNDGEFIPNFAE
jgi:hypothetical protein